MIIDMTRSKLERAITTIRGFELVLEIFDYLVAEDSENALENALELITCQCEQ